MVSEAIKAAQQHGFFAVLLCIVVWWVGKRIDKFLDAFLANVPTFLQEFREVKEEMVKQNITLAQLAERIGVAFPGEDRRHSPEKE